MKISLSNVLLMLALAACDPDAALLKHEFTVLEQPGSRALAEGTNLRQDGQYAQAAHQYRQVLRETNDPQMRAAALTALAEFYGTGKGVEQDQAQQIALLKQASSLGDMEATYRLARLYQGDNDHGATPSPLHNPTEAVALLTSIRTDYPYAALALLQMRKEGLVQGNKTEIRTSPQDMMQSLTALAENENDATAMLALARIYRDGLVDAPDAGKMEHWYRRAIKAGSVSAAAELGRIWAQPDSGRKPAEALELLLQVASRDERAVAADIARLYERQGMAQQAVRWYMRAATDPDCSSSVYRALAQAYATGWGVEKNDATALAWNIKAAQAGSAGATEEVMRAYFNGTGTRADAMEGDRWMERLFTLRPERKYAIAKDFAEGDRLPQSEEHAFLVALSAAQDGNAKAARYVAYAYEHGTGVAVNHEMAQQWFTKAGIKRPQAKAKRHVRPDENPLTKKAEQLEIAGQTEEALTLYRKAAEAGDSTAMLRVASLYATGMGITQDMHEAYRWYHLAAESGNAEGQYQLGLGYARGLGVEKDEAKARIWLEKAAGNGYPLAKETLNALLAAGR